MGGLRLVFPTILLISCGFASTENFETELNRCHRYMEDSYESLMRRWQEFFSDTEGVATTDANEEQTETDYYYFDCMRQVAKKKYAEEMDPELLKVIETFEKAHELSESRPEEIFKLITFRLGHEEEEEEEAEASGEANAYTTEEAAQEEAQEEANTDENLMSEEMPKMEEAANQQSQEELSKIKNLEPVSLVQNEEKREEEQLLSAPENDLDFKAHSKWYKEIIPIFRENRAKNGGNRHGKYILEITFKSGTGHVSQSTGEKLKDGKYVVYRLNEGDCERKGSSYLGSRGVWLYSLDQTLIRPKLINIKSVRILS